MARPVPPLPDTGSPVIAPPVGNRGACRAFPLHKDCAANRMPVRPFRKDHIMRGVLAWAIGIPIPIIILLYLVDVF
ncbi:MAG: hypothetical protein KF887_19175 [Paracoccaceae bacterium]|nr:MAG: hypothetical protein KF887_19175 [Paracoccaceae bacterium]